MKRIQRIIRPLTAAEQDRYDAAIKAVEENEDALREEVREMKRAWDQTALIVQAIVSQLKAERVRQQLTPADVQKRSVLQASAVSRLETDPHANPTLITLQRYADALGCRIAFELMKDAAPAGNNEVPTARP